MSGIKGRSGRKPRAEEERKLYHSLFPLAVSRIKEILEDKYSTPENTLRAAQSIIDHKLGKAPLAIDHRVKGEIAYITADQLEEYSRTPQLEERKLISHYIGTEIDVFTEQTPENDGEEG